MSLETLAKTAENLGQRLFLVAGHEDGTAVCRTSDGTIVEVFPTREAAETFAAHNSDGYDDDATERALEDDKD